MYTSTKGFHFQDSEGILSDIIDVKVMDTQFAPFGFDPSLISFDKDNIYVNLNGSMCHIAGMASMLKPDIYGTSIQKTTKLSAMSKQCIVFHP
jgi:hypothetical protein